VPAKLFACLAVLGLLALGGCNTAAGLGEDVRNTGDWINKKAEGRDKADDDES
jgi:predicted small secreted protein